VTVIGVSLEFRELMQTQNVDPSCKYGKVVGVQLHTFTQDSWGNGASIQNVSFSGFVDTGCDEAFAVNFDDEVRRTRKRKKLADKLAFSLTAPLCDRFAAALLITFLF